MPRTATMPRCAEHDSRALEQLARSRPEEARMVERAKSIRTCLEGERIHTIAPERRVRPHTVIKWRRRFAQAGLTGLKERPRRGKPVTYGVQVRPAMLETVELSPPAGQARWDGPAVANHLKTAVHAVWRLLRTAGICLSRQRSGCVSTDSEFIPTAADIGGLDRNPPENAVVISVDEHPSIQALERATGDVETDNGHIVRGFRSTDQRHGTLTLVAALEVATGAIHTQTTPQQRRLEWRAFMDQVLTGLPSDKEIHVILDKACIHKPNDDWLAAHPKVHVHFTPTAASWLNQVAIWFGIWSRTALRGANCDSIEHVRHAIEACVAAYGPTATPCVWRKREVKGAQLRNTIANLRH